MLLLEYIEKYVFPVYKIVLGSWVFFSPNEVSSEQYLLVSGLNLL